MLCIDRLDIGVLGWRRASAVKEIGLGGPRRLEAFNG